MQNGGGKKSCTVITLTWQALLKILKSIAFDTSSAPDSLPNWLLLFITGIHHLPVLLLNSPQTSAQSHQAVRSSAFMGLSIKWLLISKSEWRQAPWGLFPRLRDSRPAQISQVKEIVPYYVTLLVSKPMLMFFFFLQLLIDTMALRLTDVVWGKK